MLEGDALPLTLTHSQVLDWLLCRDNTQGTVSALHFVRIQAMNIKGIVGHFLKHAFSLPQED